MGSGQMVVGGGRDGGVEGGCGGTGSGCGNWCRWRWKHMNNNHGHVGRSRFMFSSSSSGFVFFVWCFIVYGCVGLFYGWLFVKKPYESKGMVQPFGCRKDSEGSWAIGVFYGDSPFSLKPIETVNIWRNHSAAWPVANPIMTCGSVSASGFPSNYVADPFLYVQGDVLYLFYETKNSITMQGDIGVAKSVDKGATWDILGIALDENWHLSYPYVFEYLGQIYMMPESSKKGELRLYRATDFPLQWTLERVIINKPLVDPVLVNHDGMYWLFASDHSGFGTNRNGQLELWYSSTPLGPWKSHKKNPIYNGEKNFGARNGGRPFVYDGNLYRIGQDCGESYGRQVHTFKVEILTSEEYKEVQVPFIFEESYKGRNGWNSARYHHLDVQQLSSSEWIGFIDGDRLLSGDSNREFLLGCSLIAAVATLGMLLGVLLGAVKSIIPLNWCTQYSGKRSDSSLDWEKENFLSSKVRQFCSRLNRSASILQGRIKPNTTSGRLVLAVIFVAGVAMMCTGVRYIYGGNGADEAYLWKGHYSQFTMLTMTYDARLWNLKLFIKHYSRCASVKEIVVVWNKGVPPKLSDLDSAVPVRIRVENVNSLNNRFNIDPLIKTRAVLELDDDIMMTCDDVERGFQVWRQHPDRIVGFYPRLADGKPLEYKGEKYARSRKGYNMILTGAAFMDHQLAFKRYWSEEAKAGRELVDKCFNCEDVLLNYLYANASTSKAVEYVRPAWAIDTSKFSGAAISRNTQVHYHKRSKCLMKFSEMYGSLDGQKWEFNSRKDGWDI
ncbi:glucosamine inositolphosphorylceramide transferase 1-like [Mangifera indica]|uniref:glucosamine inositolphosphorylceramide transferase 1-like n=1 Tax=Mangifera indica TaxID=29780 RepID=UPI001CFA32DA|nr:glucosamine inositolphosphorylceramide transferase 1-like [Mangifera indica]